MKYTKNYNFKKPEPYDTRNINDINDSFDLVDAKLKETQDKNVNLDETFKQLIIDKGNSNAEIVASRRDKINNKTHNSLPDRLDSVSSQLAQTANELWEAKADQENVQYIKKIPTVSFTSDDGWAQELTIMKPILDEYNVPATCALISNNLSNIKERLDLQHNHGWEFASHTVTHSVLTSLTEEEIDNELKNSKTQLESLGFKINTIVYPTGASNETVERIAKKYYKSGYRYQQGVNSGVIDSFRIYRVPLGAYYNTTGQDTLEFYKSKVDEAIANNGWVIFCLHPYADTFDTTQQQYLRNLIEYVQEKNILITTLSDGYKIHGNMLESGYSYNYKGITIAKDGDNNIPIAHLKPITYTINSPITDFPLNKVSVAEIGNYQGAGFPESTGGTLTTFRFDNFKFQLWMPGTNNHIYKRIYANNKFYDFAKIDYNQDEVGHLSTMLTMNTVFQKISGVVTKYLLFEDIVSYAGIQPTLIKKMWAKSELSLDSNAPTIIGAAGTQSGETRNLLAYLDVNGRLYLKYSVYGNNYDTYFVISFC